MSLVAMCASYKTMELDELGSFAIPSQALPRALGELASHDGVDGAVVLSTCNRVEAYVDARTEQLAELACRELFACRGPRAHADDLEAAQGFRLHRGEEVVCHLFRVVCSLDSQVLGETQILGQAKDAFSAAEGAGTCTETLTRLFKDAFSVGKRVRSKTDIGRSSVSLATAALKVASRELEDLSARTALIVGAGQMAELMAGYLSEAGASKILVANRTQERASALAAQCGGRAIPFEERYSAMAEVDVVFTMTSAETPVIEAEGVACARRAAGAIGRKLVVVDEAMPRDVERECASLPGVVVHDLEALGRIVDEGRGTRMASVDAAERLIANAEGSFLAWMRQRSVTPTIREMYAMGSAVVEAELARAARSLAALHGGECAPEELKVVEAFGNAVMKKMLHGPTARLRTEAELSDSSQYTDIARYLFGLDAYPEGCSPRTCSGKECLSGSPCPKGLGA